jgi:hypothetical protein
MRESFVFYASFYKAIEELDEKKQLKLYKSIMKLALENEENENLSGIEKAIFELIKPQILANNKRYEDGKKGGRPNSKKTSGYEKEKTTGFENEKPNVNVNVNDNENVNVNENVNENAPSEQKTKKEVFLNSSNPDLMFDSRINEVFSLYKKLCPNLCPLVFEERNLERRQEIKDLLVLCRNDLNYIQGLFMRANEQITFYDNKINLKSLIKNHEAIYQGLGKKESAQKETAESMKDKFKEWEQRAKEREAQSV